MKEIYEKPEIEIEVFEVGDTLFLTDSGVDRDDSWGGINS
jgi:hypothetical protein